MYVHLIRYHTQINTWVTSGKDAQVSGNFVAAVCYFSISDSCYDEQKTWNTGLIIRFSVLHIILSMPKCLFNLMSIRSWKQEQGYPKVTAEYRQTKTAGCDRETPK